jgi:TonB family protein
VTDLDPFPRLLDPSARDGKPDGLTRWAIAAAVLLHLALILWFLIDPRFAPPVIPKPAIPVTLVMVAPPPPKPPSPAQPPVPAKSAPRPPLSYRESGPDQKTTAPPRAAEPAPEPAAPEAPPSPPEIEPTPPAPAAAAQEQPPAPPSPTGTAAPEAKPNPKPKPHPTVAPAEPRKEAAIPRAPPTHFLLNLELGERQQSGDPYLNMLYQRIEQNRQPTTPIGSSGLHLEGIATFRVLLDRGGRMHEINLVRSSGASQLDDEVRRMIVSATPFPPLPFDYPDQVAITVTIPLFPR